MGQPLSLEVRYTWQPQPYLRGLPTGLLDSVKVEAGKHSPLIGWAADGFPMYAVYG